MTTKKNLKKRSTPPASRKRLTATGVTPITAEAATQTTSFQAALVECATVPVAKRAVKRRAAKPQTTAFAAVLATAPEPVSGEVAAPAEPQTVPALVRAWSWLRVKYAFIASRKSPAAVPPQEKPHATLTDGTKKPAQPRRRATSLARTKSASSYLTTPNAMARAFSWLQTKYTITTARRLRVSETVQLGEKRFVALVSVEGREFLIGGGASGVSMLAHLTPHLTSGQDATRAPQIGGMAQ